MDFSTKQILERKCFLGKLFSQRNFLPSIRLKKVNQRRQISKVVYFLKLVVKFRLTHKSIYLFHTQHILRESIQEICASYLTFGIAKLKLSSDTFNTHGYAFSVIFGKFSENLRKTGESLYSTMRYNTMQQIVLSKFIVTKERF